MKRFRSRILALIVTLAMVLSLCPANFAIAAAKTTLKTKSITLEVGKTSTIVLNNKQKASTYSFTSSNKSVATVSKDGKVKAVKAGNAKVVVKQTANKKTSTIGTVSVKVTKHAAASATAAPTKAPEGQPIDLSTVKDATYDAASGTVSAKECIFSFALNTPLANGQSISVTVKGKYNGSKGFRSWLVDDSNTTMSDIAGTDKFPTAPGSFTATYTLTAIGNATRLYFKGPSWNDANVDDVTITSITFK